MPEDKKTFVSPDGALTFAVEIDKDGGSYMSFGYSWHTHADLLAHWHGIAEDAAVKRFIDDLLSNKAVIAILRRNGDITDVGVTWTPADELCDRQDADTVELRYWDGTPWQAPLTGLNDEKR